MTTSATDTLNELWAAICKKKWRPKRFEHLKQCAAELHAILVTAGEDAAQPPADDAEPDQASED